MTPDLDISPLAYRLGHAGLFCVSERAWAAMGGETADCLRISEAPAAAESFLLTLLNQLAETLAQGGDPQNLRIPLPGSSSCLTLSPTHMGHCGAWRVDLD